MKQVFFMLPILGALLLSCGCNDKQQKAYIDNDYVTVYKEEKQPMPVYTAYKKDGELLGTFDTFTRWNEGGADYYQGTNYKRSLYYFPQTGLVVESEYAYKTYDMLLVRNGGWQTVSLGGDLLWGAIPDSCTMMKELQPKEQNEEYRFLAACDGGYVVRDERGRQLMTLTAAQYQQLEATFQPLQKLSDLTIVEGSLQGFPH